MITLKILSWTYCNLQCSVSIAMLWGMAYTVHGTQLASVKRDGVILIECNKIIISVSFGINCEWT